MGVNLKAIDGIKIQPKHLASCNFAPEKIELDLRNDLVNLRRCNSSLCRRRAAISASASLDGITVLEVQEHLKLYQFNTKTANRYFC